MIYRNHTEITGIFHAGRTISAVYMGLQLVWQNVRSCFGKGYWINDKPWVDADGWSNGIKK
jgi:hypothetical protein